MAGLFLVNFIGTENSTTIVFPVPIALFSVFQQAISANGKPKPEEAPFQ